MCVRGRVSEVCIGCVCPSYTLKKINTTGQRLACHFLAPIKGCITPIATQRACLERLWLQLFARRSQKPFKTRGFSHRLFPKPEAACNARKSKAASPSSFRLPPPHVSPASLLVPCRLRRPFSSSCAGTATPLLLLPSLAPPSSSSRAGTPRPPSSPAPSSSLPCWIC